MDLTNPSVSGPGAVVLAVLAYLLKVYLETRKDKREDVNSQRSSESSIVETAKSLTVMLREHINTLNGELQEETIKRKKAEQVSWALEQANAELRAKLERAQYENQQARRAEPEVQYGFDAYYGVEPGVRPRVGRHRFGDSDTDPGN